MAAAELRKLRDTDQTVAASDEDVRGRKMLDSTGEDIGTIDGLMVDDDQNKVRFLRVKSGGFLGLGAHHVMIPVDTDHPRHRRCRLHRSKPRASRQRAQIRSGARRGPG